MKANIRFNPLPSPKRGEIAIEVPAVVLQLQVSIRSPHRSEGRSLLVRSNHRAYQVSIRSPHRSEGRWCHDLRVLRLGIRGFNPLPSPKRGEIETLQVGIRCGGFQSAPLTEARGDPSIVSCLPCPICFNPLPSPKRGEIDDRSRAGQHARYVSIRSPHRSEGRSASTRAIRLASGEFQSAPLTEARGDLRASWNYSFPFTRSFNPLPSPKRGEIQHQQQDRAARYGFNPLPSPKRGEIPGCQGAALRPWVVSIRSPHRSEGRSGRAHQLG